MELRFQRKGLLAFDASILSGKPSASTDNKRGAAVRSTRAANAGSVFREIISLDLSNNAIASLTNMDLLTGLKSLDLSNNKLASLLSPTPQRQFWLPRDCARLDLSHNALVSVAPLAEMASLDWLSLGYQAPQNTSRKASDKTNATQQSSIIESPAVFDISTLAFLPSTSLRMLDVSGLALRTTEPIEHLVRLERLNLSDNQLASIDALRPLAKMGRAGLAHLTVTKNPLCPHSASVPETLVISLMGHGDEGITPFLETLNGSRVEAIGGFVRRSQSVRSPVGESGAAVSRSAGREPVRVSSDESQLREGKRHNTQKVELSVGDSSAADTSFTPEYGHSKQVRNGQSLPSVRGRTAENATVGFTVDVDSIRLQEMHKLLQELSMQEEQLQKKYRTQQLSIAANTKVASDQKLKLEALVELEEDLLTELVGLERQLTETDANKLHHSNKLIESRISYAV